MQYVATLREQLEQLTEERTLEGLPRFFSLPFFLFLSFLPFSFLFCPFPSTFCYFEKSTNANILLLLVCVYLCLAWTHTHTFIRACSLERTYQGACCQCDHSSKVFIGVENYGYLCRGRFGCIFHLCTSIEDNDVLLFLV